MKYDLTERYSKRVVHTFLSGKVSATLIIPLNTARKYGLDKPSDVIVKRLNDKPQGCNHSDIFLILSRHISKPLSDKYS